MNYTAATFATTHWSVVLAASRSPDAQASEALEQLCRTYWYPLYAYVRRRGYNPEDAEDLTQEFFVRFLAGNYLASVDRERAKFRSYLLGALIMPTGSSAEVDRPCNLLMSVPASPATRSNRWRN
jgi:RNA polymerase sigma-70 factor (ECF subfamily)